MVSKFLEKTIAKKVEEIIHLIIELSTSKENPLIKNDITEKIKDITPLILQYLNGNKNLVEPMLHQLIMERLPDPRIISSFGNLQVAVNSVLAETKKAIDTNEERKTVQLGDKGACDIKTAVIKAFPRANLLFNYRVGGEIIDILIVNEGLALITERKASKYIKMKYFCEKLGYILHIIPQNIVGDYRKLFRYLKGKKILQDN